jgi:hypothetical protein
MACVRHGSKPRHDVWTIEKFHFTKPSASAAHLDLGHMESMCNMSDVFLSGTKCVVTCGLSTILAVLWLLLLLPLSIQFDAEMSYRRCAQAFSWQGLSVLGSLFKVSVIAQFNPGSRSLRNVLSTCLCSTLGAEQE